MPCIFEWKEKIEFGANNYHEIDTCKVLLIYFIIYVTFK
jgi:hypothetical protein